MQTILCYYLCSKQKGVFEIMNKNMKNTEEINTHHIDVLDGIRSLAVIIVVWFHFWQQSWVSPSIQTPYLSFFNIHYISLDWLPRTGYIMVVMMLFLSGFCLYLPYARHIINGEPLPSTKSFFKKRVARILPSYIFCIITILLINIFTCAYTSPSFPLRDQSGFMLKDVLTHLTFSFNLFPDVSSNTLLNGVLWTVALEVQFYILFPWIQKCFQHKPVLTYCIMNAISYTFILYST